MYKDSPKQNHSFNIKNIFILLSRKYGFFVWRDNSHEQAIFCSTVLLRTSVGSLVCVVVCVCVCVFYSLSLASLASMALVATWARSDSIAACSAGPCDWAFFSRKWLMKSFKPSRSIPSLGIPEILVDGETMKDIDFRCTRGAKQ